MSNDTVRDIRTLGYVVRRTNYGESDRILNIITPVGEFSVIAKGVRKPRSKLAGAIEMFTLTDYNIHLGRSELGIVTGAKMVRHYREIMKDYSRMELAGVVLKRVGKVADSLDSPDLFKIADQCLSGLDEGWDLSLIEAWFLLHLMHATGEDVNLYRDSNGVKLMADKRYYFDGVQLSFVENEHGEYGANEIKMLRLLTTADLKLAKRVKLDDEIKDLLLAFSKTVAHM